MKIQCAAFCLLPFCLLLSGCASQATDMEPVWRQQLPETGVYMELNQGALVSDAPVQYAMGRLDTSYWSEHPALQVEGVPVITLRGVEPEQVELRFAENISDLYIYYDKVMPQSELDYVVTEGEDGALQYRLDTVYNFDFVVTTPQGTDSMLVICYRDGIREVPDALKTTAES